MVKPAGRGLLKFTIGRVCTGNTINRLQYVELPLQLLARTHTSRNNGATVVNVKLAPFALKWSL